ncbi:23S rRNA pseudouridine2605 synthase [Halpernia frigidisoli]|uniref:Pseudouridine synthase n=1 Tax=Halpernia frigidisoli TaxID=1125876 RepID=A0A1I3DVH0_9FLAO|nr:23S rRNA pseudouridine2605 synthase [Halpernia frigidisoli]
MGLKNVNLVIKKIVAKSVYLQKYSEMSRERKTGSNNRKPASTSKPKPSARSAKPKFEKKIEKREPRILNNSEVNSFEKSFTAKPSRSAVGKRVGKSFDSSAKFEKGDYKAGPKKVFKNFDKNFGKDMTAEKTKSFVLKRRFDKIANETPKDTIRLNKYIANSGICSRREADTLITQGLVEVNGKVTTEMGYQVEKTDRVVFDGNNITPEKPVYVLLNKPKGYISTTKDEKARKTVMDLVANASPYRTFPVGRLDRQTTGVILLTNDGHITKKLTHPSFNLKKIYHVTLDRKLTNADLQQIKDGVRLEEGVAEVDSVSFIEGKPKNEVGIELHIGWNRVVRRIFRKLGYEVDILDRVMFAGLTKKNIKRGHWRILTELEVNTLKMM